MKRTAWHLNVLLSLCCFGILQAQRSSVYFGRNTFDLDARARFKVDSLAHVASSASVISLQGFCDSVGSSAFNDALAMKRVQAVRERMIADGIPAGKIRVQALGERGAINKNLDEHERAMNRRVTIDLIRAGSTHPAASAPVEKVQIVITGTVTNENKEPAQAEISLYDLEGRQVKSTTCDELGTYAMVVKVDRGQDYFLYYYNDSAFIASTTVNASNAAKPFSNLRTVLPSLKKGSKYQLGNLNFMGGSPQLLPSSRPSMEAA